MRRNFLFCLFSFFSITLFAKNQYNTYQYMDQIALEARADKSSAYHNYTEVYSQYLDSIKDDQIKFLEIGIDRGNSVKLWEKYLPNAELHFIDITFERVNYFSERSTYHLANQEDPNSLRSVMEACNLAEFDVIIDDGGHTMQQQVVSLQTLFPYVKKGGLYIIEDLHTSYWHGWGLTVCRKTKKKNSAIEFLKNLIDDLNFVGAKTTRASHKNLDPEFSNQLNMWQKDIESIHFYDSVVIIKKR